MSLLIFTTSPEAGPANCLVQLLQHYFASPPGPQLHITTKYYTCSVPVQVRHDFQTYQQTQHQDKTDMVVFLFGSSEPAEGVSGRVDCILGMVEAEAAVVVVDGPGDWAGEAEIAQCESVVPVVYEDLAKVAQVRPQRRKGGLLSEQGDEGGILQLLELLETNQWTNMQKITKKQPIVEQSESTPEHHALEKQQPKQEEQMSEEQMQAQMQQFEMMMQQMMSIKSMPASDAQRKKLAEDLIFKMASMSE